MKREDEIRKELEEMAPFLANLKKEKPPEVPFGYFDRMQEEILEKSGVRNRSLAPEPTASWLDRLVDALAFILRPQMALALASVAIVIGAGLYMQKQNNSVAQEIAQATLAEDANAYIVAHLDEFDDELLMAIVLEEGAMTESTFPETSEEEELIDEILDELEGLDIEDLL